MVYQCHAVQSPNLPLKGYLEPDTFKLFLNDPGLLANLAGIRYSDIMLDTNIQYKGILAESYVAGQLVSANVPLLYWRNHKLPPAAKSAAGCAAGIPQPLTARKAPLTQLAKVTVCRKLVEFW